VRLAADKVRKRTGQISIATALSMLIGAFIASTAAAIAAAFATNTELCPSRRESA